jgi:hypothetical protein
MLFLYVASAWVRFRLADLANWGVDEAANLWLASRILAGEMEPLGLVSSVGVRNLAGAPLMGMPFTFLPDLLSISCALSIIQLASLAFLGFFLGHRKDWRTFTTCVLLFFPSMVLASSSLWNQYLVLPISAANLALLLFLLEGQGGARLRAGAASAVVALALWQPAVHLMSFVDLAVHLVLLCVVLAFRPRPFSAVTAATSLFAIGAAASFLYAPWVLETYMRLRGRWGLTLPFVAIMIIAVCAVPLLVRRYDPQAILDRILADSGRSRVLSWIILIVLLTSLAACAYPSLPGAQSGQRLIAARDPFGLAMLAAQAAVTLSLLPALLVVIRGCMQGLSCRELMLRCFPTRSPAAMLLLVYAGLLLAGRLVLNRTILSPAGRCDLLVSLVPALLAPLLLLVQETVSTRMRAACAAAAALVVGVLFCFALVGPSRAFWSHSPRFVPPSEMREAVDWVAARHRESGGGGVIDLGYDLEYGREWIVEKVTRFPGFRWYSIGRPYDWLLWRRHGLVNAHEGAVERKGGNGFQFGYQCDGAPPSDMQVILQLDHLQIRQWR